MKKLKIVANMDNLAYNFEKVREITGYADNAMPILKANAYNIGAINVVNRLLKLDIPQKKYFVFALKEGIELRKLFPQLERISVLNGVLDGDEKYFKEYGLTPVVNSFQQLELCKRAGINEVILQFNTGMNRAGMEVGEAKKAREFIDKNSMKVAMVMTHFCCADDKDSPVNQIQIDNFKKAAKYFPEEWILKSMSASDAIMNFDLKALCNSCRPGLALYGYYDDFKPVTSIYSYIRSDGKNLILPLGLENGFTGEYGNGDAYVLYNGVKIFVKSMEKNKIILDTDDKSLIDKEVTLLGESISYKDFEKMCGTDIRDIVARLISNCDRDRFNFQTNVDRRRDIEDDSTARAYYTVDKNNQYTGFYSTILEKRDVAEDGIVGYGATENVRTGDKLAVFFGGYLDGLSRTISNKGCSVFVEGKNGNLVECEIFGRISMDQTIIKIPEKDFDNIEVGTRVIIFDRYHPVERFEQSTGKTKEELFFYMDKSSRVKKPQIKTVAACL